MPLPDFEMADPMTRWAILTAAIWLMPILMAAGCSKKAELPALTAVSGTVTMGGKPVSGVSVLFLPGAGTPGDGGYGTTGADGRYTLQHRSGEHGVQPGTYAVIFSKFAMPDGTPVAADIQPESVGARQVIPQRYTNPDTSGMIANVTDATGTFDFELKSK
jgi:hypothetical protein